MKAVMKTRHLLFVCTGNICRSPMAEGLLRHQLGAESPWVVRSAGTFAVEGVPASAHAIRVLAGRGIDLRRHRSRQLTLGLVREADIVVAMAQQHCDQIRAEMPDARRKLFLMGAFLPDVASRDIDDPIGGNRSVYQIAAETIADAIPGLVAFLHAWQPPADGSEA